MLFASTEMLVCRFLREIVAVFGYQISDDKFIAAQIYHEFCKHNLCAYSKWFIDRLCLLSFGKVLRHFCREQSARWDFRAPLTP